METKVLLYDANNVKIGETFVRRARQLVKQQRAVWTDDSHSAVRFAPDMDGDWEASAEEERGVGLPASEAVDDSLLIAMAANRISRRKLFLVHSIAFMPMAFFIVFFAFALGSDTLIILGLGAWVACYGIHGIIYAVTSGRYPLYIKGGRKARELAEEVAMLKTKFYS